MVPHVPRPLKYPSDPQTGPAGSRGMASGQSTSKAVDFLRQENSIGNDTSGVQFLENDILFAWPAWLMVVSLLEVESG